MQPNKVIFIESSFDTTIKHGELYGKIDGHNSALNLEALLAEEYNLGYELVSFIPVIGNISSKMMPPNNVTIGHHVCLQKIKD